MKAIMSRNRRIIELEAPSFMQEKEVIESAGHKCNYCSGNGWFWGSDDDGQDVRHIPCPFCGGAGVLDAVVTIEWRQRNNKETKK